MFSDIMFYNHNIIIIIKCWYEYVFLGEKNNMYNHNIDTYVFHWYVYY